MFKTLEDKLAYIRSGIDFCMWSDAGNEKVAEILAEAYVEHHGDAQAVYDAAEEKLTALAMADYDGKPEDENFSEALDTEVREKLDDVIQSLEGTGSHHQPEGA